MGEPGHPQEDLVKNPIALTIRPSEWTTAWRQDTGHVVLISASALRLQDLAEVTVPLGTGGETGTLLGTVVGSRRQGAQFQIEIAPVPESLRVVSLAAAAARGVPVSFRKRATRHRLRIPVVVAGASEGSYMNTTSVSAGGCAIRWSGPLPAVGQAVGLRFGVGSRAVCLQGVVRWARNRASGPAVGVEFQGGSHLAPAWSKLLASAAADSRATARPDRKSVV
jgi:hypothetical protein